MKPVKIDSLNRNGKINVFWLKTLMEKNQIVLN